MTPVCTYTDYFVICTGQNPRQTKAIYDEVYAALKSDSRTLPATTDVGEAKWIVVDYIDVVLHIFTPEARAYYALEDLWGDVPSVSVEAVSA
jgi:ribosome-associated protein